MDQIKNKFDEVKAIHTEHKKKYGDNPPPYLKTTVTIFTPMTLDKLMINILIQMFSKKLQDTGVMAITSNGQIVLLDEIPDTLDHLYNETKASINASLKSLGRSDYPMNDFMASIIKECQPE